jgi:hypothetical protein
VSRSFLAVVGGCVDLGVREVLGRCSCVCIVKYDCVCRRVVNGLGNVYMRLWNCKMFVLACLLYTRRSHTTSDDFFPGIRSRCVIWCDLFRMIGWDVCGAGRVWRALRGLSRVRCARCFAAVAVQEGLSITNRG